MINLKELKLLLLAVGVLFILAIKPAHAHHIESKNWHQVTHLEQVCAKWKSENAKGALIDNLSCKKDGIYHKVNPNNKTIINFDDIYQYSN